MRGVCKTHGPELAQIVLEAEGYRLTSFKLFYEVVEIMFWYSKAHK